ncbi:hypothetical protein E3N88_42143 [Mikania micrantha]|uniref:Uncharacterized protein n=1 Tax=Mikania micrantha TaxID=192012 RepID=A0A5N6LJH0_9ASTR|nr:hypothetical protein E3N88_42143 [Mikania micrantha]
MDLTSAGENRFIQIHEIEELRNDAYDSSNRYKERTKTLHDSHLKDNKQFQVGDRVLLYNSRLRLFPSKLKSRWSGPYTVHVVFPYGTVEIGKEDGMILKVNGHRLKKYLTGPIEPTLEIEPLKCLSWDLVVSLNQQIRLQPLITEPWSRLLYFNSPQYHELLMEFFASYSFSIPSQNIYRKRFGLTFRLGGRWRRLSAAQFATRMGLYTEVELDTDVFDGLHDFEDEIEKAMFWAEVVEGVYDPRRAKATKLHDLLHYFTHVCDTSPFDMRTLWYMQIVEKTPVGMRLRELSTKHELFNQRIDNFQAEQTRQYDLLHQIQDDQRWSFQWLFASHQSAAAFHQFDVSEPPRFDYGYSSGGAQKCSRGGHDGEAIASGPHDDKED